MLIGFDRSSQSRPRIQVLWFRTLSRLNWDERFLGLGHLEAEMIRQISRRGSYETIQPYGADSQHGYIYESEGSHSERRWRMPSLRLRLWGWLLDRSIETMVLSYIINYEARGVNSTGWIVKRNVKNDRAMVIFFFLLLLLLLLLALSSRFVLLLLLLFLLLLFVLLLFLFISERIGAATGVLLHIWSTIRRRIVR